nr:uncharacterized protein LOC118878727 [Drosophila suzukii]
MNILPGVSSQTLRWEIAGLHHYQLLGSLCGAAGHVGFYGEEEKGTAVGAISSYFQNAGRLPVALDGTAPFPIRLLLPQSPICLLGPELDCIRLAKDGKASVGREGSFILLIYMNKNIC